MRRTPPLYPDAVTLEPGVVVADLLDRVDTGPGCSIKDSFSDLDLRAHGFSILMLAEWIERPAAVPTGAGTSPTPWTRIADDRALARWAEAWADAGDPTDLFRPALLRHPDIVVLGAWVGDERRGRRTAEPQRGRGGTLERLRDDRARPTTSGPAASTRSRRPSPAGRSSGTSRVSHSTPRCATGSRHWGRCGSGSSPADAHYPWRRCANWSPASSSTIWPSGSATNTAVGRRDSVNTVPRARAPPRTSRRGRRPRPRCG